LSNLFTERHHAFISATFYRLLKEGNYQNFRAVFRMATRRYAEQRGSRMAQRALRDGRELDYAAYRYYGEWEYTKEYIDSIKDQLLIVAVQKSEDYSYAVYHCPWADVYREMGLQGDGGCDYCSDLDPSIARGFNPHLTFKVRQTLHESDTCIHTQQDAHLEKDGEYGSKVTENIKGFDYHCGHVYKTFSETLRMIYEAQGVILSARVLEIFAEKFGQEMADVLAGYLSTDFNLI